MRIILQPAGQRRLRAELNVGLIRHHQRFTRGHRQQLTDIVLINQVAGRVVRAAKINDFDAIQLFRDSRQV